MECIELPLVSGDINDIAAGGTNNNDGETNGNADDDDDDDGPSTQKSYESDSNIKPDFSILKNSLKNVMNLHLN